MSAPNHGVIRLLLGAVTQDCSAQLKVVSSVTHTNAWDDKRVTTFLKFATLEIAPWSVVVFNKMCYFNVATDARCPSYMPKYIENYSVLTTWQDILRITLSLQYGNISVRTTVFLLCGKIRITVSLLFSKDIPRITVYFLYATKC